jgi:hypothetical protein
MLAGTFVTCLTRKYRHLVFGNAYQIERVTWKGSLKFVGHRHLYDRNNFALAVGAAPEANKPAPKPIPVKKTLAEQLMTKAGLNAGTCSYGIEFEDGRIRLQSHDACHARMRFGNSMSHGDSNIVKPKAVACYIRGHVHSMKDEYKEAYKLHVKYMLNDSPWADAWLTKDVDEALKGCAMMDVTKPYSYVCSAAIAMRSGSEFASHALPLFKRLLDMKYSPHVAYLMSHMTQVKGEEFTVIRQGGSHHVFHSGMNLNQVVDFFDNKKLSVNDKPYNEAFNTYYTIFKTIANEHPAENNTLFTTIRDDNPEFLKDSQAQWVKIKTTVVNEFNDYLKIVNTFARKFK